MANNPREYKKYVGIIVDRNGPDNSCKVFLPEIHGKDVKIEDLGWSRFVTPPGASGGTTNFGTPDAGQLVTCIVNTTGGSTLTEITGLYQTKQAANPSNPGNLSLTLALPQWQAAINQDSGIRIPPTIQEQTVDGAKVRVAVEKDQTHKHSLLIGINSTGALPPLNGTILPSLSIGTAIQPSSSTFSASLQLQLPGVGSTITSLLSSTFLSPFLAALPPEISAAIVGYTTLMTSVSTTPSDGTYTSGSIDASIFANNAANLINTITTASDVPFILQELATNTALHRASSNVTAYTTTEYGDATITIDPMTGTLSLSLSNDATSAASAFASMVSGIIGATGSPMFGNSSPTIQSMGERLVDDSKKAEFKVRLSLNASQSTGTDSRIRIDTKAISFVAG